MGVTKQYLRYVLESTFGIIASAKGGVVSIGDKNLVASATAENVTVWNLKTGERVLVLPGGKSEVTAIAVSPNQDRLAIGYGDGNIKMFVKEPGEWSANESIAFSGHKSAINCLAFDTNGHRLASGGKDTNVIVWDVVNECGLYRLKGHKGPVTQVAFHEDRNMLVSSSKDTLVKFWDLNVQHCFKTLTGHITEVWDFALVKDYIITGSSDSELRVFKLTFKDKGVSSNSKEVEPMMKRLKVEENGHDSSDEQVDEDEEEEEADETEDFDAGVLKVERIGSLLRQGQDKVAHIACDPEQRLLTCHGSDNTIEMFLVCSDEEVKKRLSKRAKKEKRKLQQSNDENPSSITVDVEPTIQEEFRRLSVIRVGGKVRHLQVWMTKEDSAKLLVSTANNLIETYKVDLSDVRNVGQDKTNTFELGGHRSDVRTVAFSSCSTAIASVSHEALKIWSRKSQTCIRTIPSGYGLSCLFVPGDRHVLVGTKKGSLQIFDLNKAEISEEVHDAHSKEIWSMCLYPDRKGFVTASADQTVKFWSFEPLKDREGWSVVHTRTLQLEEDALSVKLSPDGKFVAVSLLDSTIKVFFVDTLKFFLSLYGHKLPALSIDISSDSTLVATASADKNVKIWGLDFGDCHKSIFAHDDSITAVQFVPNTHYFFTAGKDGKVKQWDADNFERIVTLDGHHGEVWSLAISPSGKHLVTSGHDKTLRLWEKTQEPLVLEDERETEREKEDEEQLAIDDNHHLKGNQDREVDLATKKTAVTERAAERLMEAIQVYKQYKEECQTAEAECSATGKPYVSPALPVIMSVYPEVGCAEDYMAMTLASVKSSEVEECLLVLPLDYVISLIEIIEFLLKRGFKSEIVIRTFFFLLEIHFGPLTSSKQVRPLIEATKKLAMQRASELKQVLGFNLAALRHVQNRQAEEEKVQALLAATGKFRDKRRKKKQKQRALQTAIISL